MRPCAASATPSSYVTALVARWHAVTKTFTWINCGHPHAYLVDTDGNVNELEGPSSPAARDRRHERQFTVTERHLASDERLILVTDGITERRTESGDRFGIEGIRRAVRGSRRAPRPPRLPCRSCMPSATAGSEPLEDDGTVVVLSVA